LEDASFQFGGLAYFQWLDCYVKLSREYEASEGGGLSIGDDPDHLPMGFLSLPKVLLGLFKETLGFPVASSSWTRTPLPQKSLQIYHHKTLWGKSSMKAVDFQGFFSVRMGRNGWVQPNKVKKSNHNKSQILQ